VGTLLLVYLLFVAHFVYIYLVLVRNIYHYYVHNVSLFGFINAPLFIARVRGPSALNCEMFMGMFTGLERPGFKYFDFSYLVKITRD